jgi:hypothetical protein
LNWSTEAEAGIYRSATTREPIRVEKRPPRRQNRPAQRRSAPQCQELRPIPSLNDFNASQPIVEELFLPRRRALRTSLWCIFHRRPQPLPVASSITWTEIKKHELEGRKEKGEAQICM